MWHAIIILQSAPRPHLRYNFKILPAHQTQNLEQTLYQSPNKNLTLWPKLTLQICTKLLSACFSSSKLWISKKYTLFHFLWKTTSITHLTLNTFYPGQWKNRKTLNNFFLGLDYSCKYTHNKMSNQGPEDVLYWQLGILNCTWCHDSKRWDRNQLGMVESTFELQLLTTSWSLWILNRNTEMN